MSERARTDGHLMSYYLPSDTIVAYTWGEGAMVCVEHTPTDYTRPGFVVPETGNPVTPVFANEMGADDTCDVDHERIEDTL